MLLKIGVMSHYQFETFCKKNDINDENVEKLNTSFVSIINGEGCIRAMFDGEDIHHYFKSEHANVINLEFDDVSEDFEYNGEKIIAMPSDDAVRLVDFIEKRIQDGSEEFIIHCWAGQSRSQAVARFIRETYGGTSSSLYPILETYNVDVLAKLRKAKRGKDGEEML